MARGSDAVVDIPPAFAHETKDRKIGFPESDWQSRTSPWSRKEKSSQDRSEELFDDDEDLSEEEDTFGLFGRLYERIGNLPILLRYAVYIIPVGVLIAIPIIVLGVIKQRVPVGPVRLIGLFIWLELVWVTLWGSNLAARAIPPVFRLFSGFLSKDTQKYSNLLKALEVPITLVIWAACAYGSVALLYLFPYDPDAASIATRAKIPWNQPGSPWTETMKRVFLATVPVACVYLVEKIIVEWIAVNYHETQFASKVKEVDRWIALITDLYQTSLSLYPRHCSKFQVEDEVIHGPLPSSKHHTSHIVRKVDSKLRRYAALSPFFGHGAVDSDLSVVIAALGNEKDTIALARRIWFSLVQGGASDLYEEDIVRSFDRSRRADAEALFTRLDFNRNGAVSLEEMTGMFTDVARHRKAVTRSISDVQSSIRTFSAILAGAGFVGMAIIYAAFFSATFIKNLQVIFTAVLSLSFAFAGTVQEFAASFMFLFVKHPYDVGDRCEIADQQVEVIVEKISLLHTIFRRVLDNRLVQIPNSVVSAAAITNISRSRNLKQRIHIMVNVNTTGEQIESLQSELYSFVTSSTSKRDYTPDVSVMISAIDAYESIDMVIVYGHKSNWSKESLRLARRNRFMAEVLAAMRRLAIKPPGGTFAGSGSLEYPQYTVEVTKEEVQAARDEVEEKVSARRNGDNLDKSIIKAKQDIPRPSDETVATGATSTGVDRAPVNSDGVSSRWHSATDRG